MTIPLHHLLQFQLHFSNLLTQGTNLTCQLTDHLGVPCAGLPRLLSRRHGLVALCLQGGDQVGFCTVLLDVYALTAQESTQVQSTSGDGCYSRREGSTVWRFGDVHGGKGKLVCINCIEDDDHRQ
jgi:hypothetical protein